jgi:hypothetical protein
MSKLYFKAAKEAQEFNRKARNHSGKMSDNLNDIQLYLDENKNSLPDGSEVSVKELFTLLKNCIEDYEQVEFNLHECNEWILALAE